MLISRESEDVLFVRALGLPSADLDSCVSGRFEEVYTLAVIGNLNLANVAIVGDRDRLTTRGLAYHAKAEVT